jgi:hypothetical protein
VSAELLAPSQVPAVAVPAANAVPLAAGAGLAEWVADVVWTAEQNAPRSQQRAVGPSELGMGCSRQIAYRLAGTVPVNMTVDPLAAVVGRAMHTWMAQLFAALGPPGRYLVEHAITFRGVPGTLDLYDRRNRTVIDWKFPRKAKVNRMRASGPPRHYIWQGQVYAAGLAAAGEAPVRIAVVYLPVDGTLADALAFAWPVAPLVAEEAVDRLDTVAGQLGNDAEGHPGQVPAQPSRLCPWCPYHRPQWTGDTDVACPADTKPT